MDFVAYQSTFNQVARDQINYNIHNSFITYQICNSTSPTQTAGQASSSTQALAPYSHPRRLGPRDTLISTPGVVFLTGVAMDLIRKVVRLLVSTDGEACHDLKLALESLHTTLDLTESAMQAYEHTPLQQCLEDNVHPRVLRCFVVLQEVFDEVNHYRESLRPTAINWMWRQVCRNGGELASSKTKLGVCQRSLDEFLVALNSVEWARFGDMLSSGRVSLGTLFAQLSRRIPFLHHIKVDAVVIVDHLGQNIPVPVLFCSRWKDFNYIINGYCRDRIGDRFIQRGDYQVIRARDSKAVAPSELARTLAPGIVFEMSVVLRQNTQDTECPRCGHVNQGGVPGSWIECSMCSGKFQVTTRDDNTRGVEKKGGQEVQDQESGTDKETGGGDEAEEIFSPAVQASVLPAPSKADEKQYFRRILVIRKGVGSSPKRVHFADSREALETVHVFIHSLKPHTISLPGDESDTESEEDHPSGFPFPVYPPTFEIDHHATSQIPALNPPPHANLYVESIKLSRLPDTSKPARPCSVISISVLVRHFDDQRNVAIRFTLDDWQTVSEISASYQSSLKRLPDLFSGTVSDLNWDRVFFNIRLDDVAFKPDQHTLCFVARLSVPSREWWDNNSGDNYRVVFRAFEPLSHNSK